MSAPEASDSAASPTKEKEFKPMKFGNLPQYPLPKIDGDPFILLLESQMKKDKARCEAWKDEVQYLLIFAGLFSAVFTAFIIESYKTLKQDPTEVLLSRILTQLEGRVNGTDILTTPKFIPTSYDVRVNILWFLSLIFSLATVLIGIIALQWLREHLRPRTDLEPQIAFSLYHLSLESLDRWYLPQIFTALPLLLQLALMLFLAGVLEFLWNLNSTVAIPVSLAVGSSLTFLLWTTVLPTIQSLSLFLPRWSWENMPRSPCPYKSPQSWAFHQSVRPLVALFLSTYGGVNIDKPYLALGQRGLVSNSMTSEKDRRHLIAEETTSRRQRRPSNLIFRPSQSNSWVELGIAWLFQRDLDFMGQNPKHTKKTSINENIRPVPVYDTVQAIISIGENGSFQDNLLAHHCVEPIVQCNSSDGSYMWYLSHLLGPYLDDERAETLSLEALRHHNTLFLHRMIGSAQQDVRNSVAEMSLKITRAMFAEDAIPLDDIWAGRYSPLTYWKLDEFPDGQEQLFDILQSYFHHAVTYHPDPADAGTTTYFSRVGWEFIRESAGAVSELKPTSPLFSRHVDLLRSLVSGLRIHEDVRAEASPPPDYLFFASFAYVYWLLGPKSDLITTPTGRDLVLAILQYRARVIPRKDIEDGFYNSYGRGWKFATKWPNFLKSARELGVVVDEEPPADLAPIEYAESRPSGGPVIEVLDDHPPSIRFSSKTDDAYVPPYRVGTW